MSATLKSVSYGRSSSGKEKSIADQLTENREANDENGWSLVEELSDPVSASRYGTKVRKNWARIGELLPTVDVVLLWEPSRGDRSLASWAAWLDECRKQNVKIHATSHRRTYDPRNARDYRTLAEDGVDATFESDRLSGRVRRGRDSRAAAGKPSSVPAYGYVRQYDTSVMPPRYKCEVEHPSHGPIVRELFEWFAAGEPLTTIATRLNQAGIPTPKKSRPTNGRPVPEGRVPVWRPNTVQRILTNRRYAPHPDNPERGTLVHGARSLHDDAVESIHIGTWPPLVTAEQWETVQQRLGVDDEATRKGRQYSPPGAVKYLLSGSVDLLTAPCGGFTSGAPGTPGKTFPRYTCGADHCTSVPMHEADEYVIALVLARFAKPDVRRLWEPDSTTARAARAEIKALERQLEENEAAYRKGEISPKLAGAREQELEQQIEQLRPRTRVTGIPTAGVALLEAVRLRKELRPVWDAIELIARRELIADIFMELKVTKPNGEHITRWTGPNERLDIVSARIRHQWRRP